MDGANAFTGPSGQGHCGDCLRSPQGHATESRRANRSWPVGPHRQARQYLQTCRMRQLLQCMRIRTGMSGNCSNIYRCLHGTALGRNVDGSFTVISSRADVPDRIASRASSCIRLDSTPFVSKHSISQPTNAVRWTSRGFSKQKTRWSNPAMAGPP